MNPVQKALSSAAMFGTTMKFQSTQNDREQKEDERFRERMDIERGKLELANRKQSDYERQTSAQMLAAQTSEYRAKTERKMANLEARRIRLEEEKMRKATEQTQADGRNARTAAETRKLIQYGGYSVPIIGGEKNA